ncbi:MAG: hypothetical protein M3Q14_00940, partial [bacterium]|nr:hypothetical protein [bacterium]
MSEHISAKLDRLEASPPLALHDVDLNMCNPELVHDELGHVFTYFARVESEVISEPLQVMLPRLGTEYRGYESQGTRFLDIWVAQEQAHGEIFMQLQQKLDIVPEQPELEVTRQDRILGLIGQASSAMHGVFEMIYLTRGAMHERLTFQGYELMAAKLKSLGEQALMESVIKPIRAQEAGHLGYYRAAAKELKAHLQPWQLWLARKLSVRSYAPVGARNEMQRAEFGHLAQTLAGEGLDSFSSPIQTIGEELLTNGPSPLPRFVLRSISQ